MNAPPQPPARSAADAGRHPAALKHDMTFRQNLKAWRERHTLDQAAAAAVLGISRRTLENWECGRNEPNQWRQPGLLAAMDAHALRTPAKTAPKPAPGNKRPPKSKKP